MRIILIVKTIIHRLALFLVDSLCLLLFASQNKSPKRKILFVRIDAIGDFIIWLNAAKELREFYPSDSNEITVLCNLVCKEIAEATGYFDKVITLDRKKFYRNLLYRFKLMTYIRRTNYDLVIHPTYSRDFFGGDSIIRISGSRQSIGFKGDFSNITPRLKRISDKWYTKLISSQVSEMMELQRNAEFLHGLGIKNFEASLPEFPLNKVTPNTKIPSSYYIIFPGANSTQRIWPPEYFATIARRLFNLTGWTGVICGGKGEEQLAQIISSKCQAVPLVNLVGKTNLLELGYHIRNATIVIANETSAIHMAAAVSTPSVCIIGGGHYGRFMPYVVRNIDTRKLPYPVTHKMPCFNCNWVCPYTPDGSACPCVKNVSIEEVWANVESILNFTK